MATWPWWACSVCRYVPLPPAKAKSFAQFHPPDAQLLGGMRGVSDTSSALGRVPSTLLALPQRCPPAGPYPRLVSLRPSGRAAWPTRT